VSSNQFLYVTIVYKIVTKYFSM